MLYHYKILSFCISAKLISRKSIICFGYNKTSAAKQMGISENAFRKYLAYCLEKGIAKKVGSHYQLIKFGEIVKILFPNTKAVKHAALFRGKQYNPQPKFAEIYNYVQFSFASINYRQQAHVAQKKAAFISAYHSGHRNKCKTALAAAKAAAKFGTTTHEYIKRLGEDARNEIVTGCKHTGKHLGCSPSTANNRLHRWNEQGLLTRKVSYEQFCFAAPDKAVELMGETQYLFRSYLDNSILRINGSKILLIALSSYKK